MISEIRVMREIYKQAKLNKNRGVITLGKSSLMVRFISVLSGLSLTEFNGIVLGIHARDWKNVTSALADIGEFDDAETIIILRILKSANYWDRLYMADLIIDIYYMNKTVEHLECI